MSEKKEVKAMNLYEKIQAVANKVRNVEKSLVVGTGNSAYKAVSDYDVVTKVKEAESEFRLLSIPVNQELVKSEQVRVIGNGGYEKITYADIVKMVVRIVNLDNTSETIEIESFGRGLDSGDKGFGKASTYARKYALLNAYKIATGEDPDQTKSDEQVAVSKDEMRDKVLNYLAQNMNYCNNILSYFGVQSPDLLTQAQIKQTYVNITKKGIAL